MNEKVDMQMKNYILRLQRESRWQTIKPVLKCCKNSNSSLGFCGQCSENFAHRLGPYYDGFRYRTDHELLTRLADGKKPFASLPRRRRDKQLESVIKRLGLHIVRRFRNEWGMLEYHVMKNVDLKLSDVGDLDSISEQLHFEVRDKKIRDIEEDPIKVIKGLMFGYPFYTLSRENYLIP